MGQKIGKKAELEQAHENQKHTGQKSQHDGCVQIIQIIFHTQVANGSSRHQRCNSNRPDRESTAGAENGIKYQWQDTGVQPHLRRDSGQQGVSQ